MIAKSSSGNVFQALGFGEEEAENLRIRALLMTALEKYIRREKISQAEAAERMMVTQPRISDLIRGRIEVFSIDTLIAMLARVGKKVSIRIRKSRAA